MAHHATAGLPPPTPWQRLTRLLDTERPTIRYIIFYAVLTGLISLSLPLGTQAVFNLVSTGAVFSSTYILVAVVVGGVLLMVGLGFVASNGEARRKIGEGAVRVDGEPLRDPAATIPVAAPVRLSLGKKRHGMLLPG